MTADGGANWSWTPITSGSSVAQSSSARSAVGCRSHGGGVVPRHVHVTPRTPMPPSWASSSTTTTKSGLVHYVDATTAIRPAPNGSAVAATGPSAAEGNDRQQLALADRFGQQQRRAGVRQQRIGKRPTLDDTSGLDDGMYDIFAYFWANPDAGLANSGRLRPRTTCSSSAITALSRPKRRNSIR